MTIGDARRFSLFHPYLVAGVIAVLSAVFYAETPGAWGSFWPLPLVIELVWGAVCGVAIAIAWGKLRGHGRDKKAALMIVTASAMMHGALGIQEEYIGLFRNGWARISDRLNATEASRNIHAVDLGEGRHIFFHDEHDEMFGTDFPYEGENRLTREQIHHLAAAYLSSKGHTLVRSEIQTQLVWYGKRAMRLWLKRRGYFIVNCWIAEAPTGVARLPTERGLPDGTFGHYDLIMRIRDGQLGFDSVFDRARPRAR